MRDSVKNAAALLVFILLLALAHAAAGQTSRAGAGGGAKDSGDEVEHSVHIDDALFSSPEGE